jgi:hypothetical protein
MACWFRTRTSNGPSPRCVELRQAGASYRAISERMRTEFGISISHQGVKRVLLREEPGGSE